jgi:hypothetical protein
VYEKKFYFPKMKELYKLLKRTHMARSILFIIPWVLLFFILEELNTKNVLIEISVFESKDDIIEKFIIKYGNNITQNLSKQSKSIQMCPNVSKHKNTHQLFTKEILFYL